MSKATILLIVVFLALIGIGIYFAAQYSAASQERRLKEQQLAGIQSFEIPKGPIGSLWESIGGFL